MIAPDASLSIQLLPLAYLQIREYQCRDLEKLQTYIHLLREHPEHYLGVLCVEPSHTHNGMFTVLDGHKRYCAYVMEGKQKAFCVVIEAPTSGGQMDDEK